MIILNEIKRFHLPVNSSGGDTNGDQIHSRPYHISCIDTFF